MIALAGSFLIFASGMYRILSGDFPETPPFSAYIFAVGGFLGVIANGMILRKKE